MAGPSSLHRLPSFWLMSVDTGDPPPPHPPPLCIVSVVSVNALSLFFFFPRMHPVEVWAGRHGRRGDARGGRDAQEVNATLLPPGGAVVFRGGPVPNDKPTPKITRWMRRTEVGLSELWPLSLSNAGFTSSFL